MSNYFDTAIRKEDLQFLPERWEEVQVLDNYFGKHQYGVRFPNGEILKIDEVYFRNEILNGTSSYIGNTKIYRDNKPNRLQKIINLIKKL